MKYLKALSVVCLLPLLSVASEINLKQLGGLQLNYQPLVIKNNYLTPPLAASVSTYPQAQYSLSLPFSPSRIDYLVENGQHVAEGTQLARLSGGEVHHFIEQYAIQKELFELAKSRYDSNKPLAAKSIISQASWQAIAENYAQHKVAWGHFNHTAEIFSVDPSGEFGYLKANQPGRYVFAGTFSSTSSTPTALVEGEITGDANLGALIANESIRLKLTLSSSIAHQATNIQLAHCNVAINHREKVSNGLQTVLWSQALPNNCLVELGQSVSGALVINQASISIPKNSVFHLAGAPHIFVKMGDLLVAKPVTIINQDSDNTILIAGSNELANSEVLTSSVASAQGILMGIGGVE